jgi:hypothetical protein
MEKASVQEQEESLPSSSSHRQENDVKEPTPQVHLKTIILVIVSLLSYPYMLTFVIHGPPYFHLLTLFY